MVTFTKPCYRLSQFVILRNMQAKKRPQTIQPPKIHYIVALSLVKNDDKALSFLTRSSSHNMYFLWGLEVC